MGRGSNSTIASAELRRRPTPLGEHLRFRFAPSPTGSLHLGSARVMLYNWLAARQQGGSLLVRIEDTDRERSSEANITEIFQVLDWLNLDYDEVPLRQTASDDRHRAVLDQLVDAGKVYRTTARKAEVDSWKLSNGRERGYRGQDEGEGAYRLRLTDGISVSFDDLIRGQTTFLTDHLDDPVIARADGSALYNFAVAIDDYDAQVSHVIRGDDHISNTPTQLLVFQAIGAAPPTYVHLPLILGPDGKKLSKRHKAPDGAPLAVTIEQLRADGYLPEAVLSYLSRLGWGTDEDRPMSREELLTVFDLAKVQPNPARFDERKLRDTNGHFLRALPAEEFVQRTSAFLDRPVTDRLRRACAACQEKCSTLADTHTYLDYLEQMPTIDEHAWRKIMKPETGQVLVAARTLIAGHDWQADSLHDDLLALATEREIGPGKVFQPIRVALTGSSVSAGIGDTITLLDRDQVLERIDQALARMAREHATA